MCLPVTDMQWLVIAVEIQAVKRGVLDDPLRHFEHVLIGDDEVTSGTFAFTDEIATGIALKGCVLVAFRVYPAGNVFGELRGTKAVGQFNPAEIIHHRVNDLQG